MELLALSGSARQASTNTALLTAMRDLAPTGLTLHVFAGIGDLPVFSPDREGDQTPLPVQRFIDLIQRVDGVIISSPEYVRTLPGGLKNAIDWLVSGEVIIHKPIALAHASHRGDDMLASLRVVLETVSTGFDPDLFIRVPLMGKSASDIQDCLSAPDTVARIQSYLRDLQCAFTAAAQAPLTN